MVTRDMALASITGGGTFVVTIITLAMMVLVISPKVAGPTDNPHD